MTTEPIALTCTPENVFVLSVKEGNFVNQYNFLSNDLQAAITKGKQYCEAAGTKRRFIHVRPFLTNFERKLHEENKPD